ncbi:sentrin sumo-specific [Colletotrichum tofieldiae]|nr:sentrin SUMO-specific [Colletotrichum tofieldiae]GKT82021.1 sentrin sumo-specific [Colletotrichum tofieldiae]
MARKLFKDRLAGNPFAKKADVITNDAPEHQTPPKLLDLDGYSLDQFTSELPRDFVQASTPTLFAPLYDSHGNWSLAIYCRDGNHLHYYDPLPDSGRVERVKSGARAWIPFPSVQVKFCPTAKERFSDGLIVPALVQLLAQGQAAPNQLDTTYYRSDFIRRMKSNDDASSPAQHTPIDPKLLCRHLAGAWKDSASPDPLHHTSRHQMLHPPSLTISATEANDWMLLLATHTGVSDESSLDKYKTQTIDAIRNLLRELAAVDAVEKELNSVKGIESASKAAIKDSERQMAAHKAQITNLLTFINSDDASEGMGAFPEDLFARIQACKKRKLESSTLLEDAEAKRQKMHEQCEKPMSIMSTMVHDLNAENDK